MFFKSSETEKEPSLRVFLKTFVRQINQLFEAYRAALTTIKDQAEQIKTLMELDKDTAELQSKIKKLEAENTAFKQEQRQQPQSNAELEETKRKLNIYVVKNQELKDELKQKTKEYDEFQCELADILDIDYFDSEALKSDIMLNVQSLKSGENISRNKESIDAIRADISSISTQFNELFNNSDDTKQEEQQSDEEKHRTFKARKQ